MKLIIIGGFLGAGKTTAILAIAKKLIKAGKSVGIVTNDQGSRLVDAEFLSANGLDVLSVEGGCLCCNFDEFSRKINELRVTKDIDYILAEPVGSCTDLVATLFKPLSSGKLSDYSLAPLSIVVDPKRAKRLIVQEMAKDEADWFPTEVNYLFEKQLREANVIVINKCDALDESEINEITEFFNDRYHGIDVLKVSAKNGGGLDGWLETLISEPFIQSESLDIDYGIYAEAEAALGWLNTSCRLTSEAAADVNERAKYFMEYIRSACIDNKTEIAHLKCFCVGQNEFYKASLTSVDDVLDESAAFTLPQREINFVVNARVGMEPELLKGICGDGIKNAFAGFAVSGMNTECFRPSPPRPTYRM